MKRYAVTTDRANGTINDSNLFDGPNPKHIVELTGQPTQWIVPRGSVA